MALKRNVRGGVPSPYPRFLFHGLRTAQLISSIVVSGIMAYFMYYLQLEHFSIPWTFIVLMLVSLLTLTFLTLTIILYNFTYLSPKVNLLLNSSCALLWTLGLALLSWSVSTSHVLAKQCTGSIWGGDAEAGVCRDYKALWSMTLFGTISTFAALALDYHTHQKTIHRGIYVTPEDDKNAQKLNDLKAGRIRSAGYEAPREQSGVSSVAWEEQDIGYHSGYGIEEETHGPLDQERDMGYHNKFFRD
jgi:hypothetical protein